jgi:nitroreductase
MEDQFQQRYLAHQARKKLIIGNDSFGSFDFKKYTPQEQETFFNILQTRTSQRNFTNDEIDIQPVIDAMNTSPSSCGRKGVGIRIIISKEEKDLLSGLLVGGTGWINRAKVILLLVADMVCYKNPVERDYMPHLDAGFLGQTAYLSCEALNLGCCFVNPNIRVENQAFFKERFKITDNELFCGALAIGRYQTKHTHNMPINEKK